MYGVFIVFIVFYFRIEDRDSISYPEKYDNSLSKYLSKMIITCGVCCVHDFVTILYG